MADVLAMCKTKKNIKYDMNTILWITDISETVAMLTFLKKKTGTREMSTQNNVFQ